MKGWIAFWNILLKDMRTYYLKPPNISWGLIFPLAWTGMFFIKSGSGLESVLSLLPGVVAISILFGTTSMLAVTVTFEKKDRSFDRLLLGSHILRTPDAGQDERGDPLRCGQCFRSRHPGALSRRSFPCSLERVGSRRFLIAVALDLSGLFHRSFSQRSFRGPDLFQLLPFPYDLPVRAVLPH